MSFFKLWRSLDLVLLASLVFLTGLGLAMLYSVSLGREGGDMSIFWRQLMVAGAGLIILVFISTWHSRIWEGLAPWLYLGLLTLLVAVLLFGQTINATRGWLSLGGARLQPVELAKVMAVIALAAFLARRSRSLDRIQNLILSFLIVLGLALPVLLQPDFGSASIMVGLWAAMLLIIGVRREYLVGLIIVGVVGFALAWAFLFRPYQKERLLTFFFPSDRTAAQSYNVKQAIIAVGSGQFLGKGLGAGSQSQLRFLPEASTDFMFATLAEELGLAGVMVVMILVSIIFVRLWWLMVHCQDWFSSFVILGAIFLMMIEISMNAGMNLGIFPVVGIPFPFLSAGGSSLLAHFWLFGIVESIASTERQKGYRGSQTGLV